MEAGEFLNWEVDDLLKKIGSLCDGGEGATPEGAGASADYSAFTPEKLEAQGYAELQIDEIQMGLAQGVPVEFFAKECYNWQQMSEIRLGLVYGVDIHLYLNPLFSSEQMHEIRMGLMENLDVSSYAKLICSTRDMRAARKNLLSDAYLNNPRGHAKTMTDEESGVSIRLSDDCMEAFVTIPEGKKFTVTELRKILKRNQVVYGVSKELLTEAAKTSGVEQKVAEGKLVCRGKDGYYEYFFDKLLPGEPKICEDGTVDYTSVVVADRKDAGDLLAKYHPATQGSDGQTVTGIVLKGGLGDEKPQLCGQGITFDEAENSYRASTSGFVTMSEDEGVLNVWNVYVVDGDINRYNGHISYNGAVYVRGSVGDMAEINASGNVVVDGYVETAHIVSGENIVLRGGMNGGTLEAGGSVAGKFFETATIYAKGDIEGNYFMNCNIVTDRSVIAKGTKSKIMGGSIKAGYSVESSAILASGRTPTMLDVGDPAWYGSRVRQAQEKLSKVRQELQLLNDGKEKLTASFGEGAAEHNGLFHKISVAIRMKEEEEEKLKGEEKYHAQVFRRSRKAYVRVSSRLEAGVTLTVGGRSKKLVRGVNGSAIISKDKL